jgi:cell division protein FtsW
MHNRLSEMSPPVERDYDKFLLIIMLLLMAFGALMIYSSTSVVTPLFEKRKITEFYYFKRHLFTMILGSFALLIAYRLKPSFLRRMSVPLLAFSFILLLLVFLPYVGVTAGGARRWIRLWPTTFQPSELVKLAMVIFLAKYMSAADYNTERFSSFLKPLLVMALFQAVFLKQPDFGATMSLGLLTFGMLFISGMRLTYLASVLVLALPVIYKLVMEPYRLRRITSFLDPWKDPQGSGFQLIQSFISIGSGGIAGLGLGESKQKLSFLPASHTDFIFCLVGEETRINRCNACHRTFSLPLFTGDFDSKQVPGQFPLLPGLRPDHDGIASGTDKLFGCHRDGPDERPPPAVHELWRFGLIGEYGGHRIAPEDIKGRR